MVIRPAIRSRPYMSSVLDSRRGPCFEVGTIVQLPACARQMASRAGVQAKKSAAPAFAGAAAGAASRSVSIPVHDDRPGLPVHGCILAAGTCQRHGGMRLRE